MTITATLYVAIERKINAREMREPGEMCATADLLIALIELSPLPFRG